MDTGELLTILGNGSNQGYIGEPISQLEHALQTANAANLAGAPETLVIASLLHDIGHLFEGELDQMPGLGIELHERLGAEYIRAAGLNEDIATLVEMHVDAKRYLVASNPDYAAKLSPASTATLKLQKGPMTADEIKVFEAHPLFKDALKIRAWDEEAKQPNLEVPRQECYRAMMRRNLLNPLSKSEFSSWSETGFLHIPGWFDEKEMTQISAVTDQIERWPETAGKWMKYFESGESEERQLCRVENFLEHSPVYDAICRNSATQHLLSILIGEPTELFKEKINFKLSGGQGFAPHQDAPAFNTFGQRYHITLMLSIDASSIMNGCLEIAQCTRHDELLDMNSDLTLTEDVVDTFEWVPIETKPGDLVIFDSYLPHRSGVNQSLMSRRALYATYNRRHEGNLRDAYFEAKRTSFPPDAERTPGRKYEAGVFNVGNPITAQ